MSNPKNHISIFEHQSLIFDLRKKEENDLHNALVKFFENGVPYYSLIRNGVKFNEFVGVIQVGNTLISVLPKSDKKMLDSKKEKEKWNEVLIDMIRAVHGFDVKAPSSGNLKTKNNSVLDLYFELFVKEVEYLLHRGLVKKYRKTEGNLTALKGSLMFSKHVHKNVVHKERFYTQYTTYDTEHLLHIILYKTLQVLKRVNINALLIGRINGLLLNFPEMPSQKITEAIFDKLMLNRKTMGYKKAIEIARLILLNYHPDLSKGRKDVLALMFDMNKLWEQFVLVSLRKEKSFKVKGQDSKYFWKPENGNRRTIRPDIAIETEAGKYVLDTKWKMVDNQPSIEDIRQMYAYHHYFRAEKVALLYPGNSPYIMGNFVEVENQNILSKKECGLMFTEFKDTVKVWQGEIVEEVKKWIENI